MFILEEVIEAPHASVFVTTYRIGNSKGFAVGKWFDLSDYADREDFLEEAKQYAREVLGDPEPELCFSDFDSNMPSPHSLFNEWGIDEGVWALLSLDEDEYKLAYRYMKAACQQFTGSDLCDIHTKAQEKYIGFYESRAELAEEFNGHLAKDLPNEIAMYIDYDSMGRDMIINNGWDEYNGHYFYN